ncbi:MAG TPA: CbiX/SirB N-terminal domain-containing protein [Streptosporangiaceae bacterium]
MRHPRLTPPAGVVPPAPLARLADRLPPLLAVAHGSRDPRAAGCVEELLDRVRHRAAEVGLAGLRVHASYLGHGLPSAGQALSALDGGPVVVLPLLLTAAYHSKIDLPAALAAAPPRLRIGYGATLGPDPLLISALERRLAEQGIDLGDPGTVAGTSVVVAAAGSSDPAASAAVTGLAAHWQALRGWRDVVPGYASAAAPSPAAAVAGLHAGGARRVVVASYLLAPGRFADQVRAGGLAAGAATVSGVLGAAPELADIVLRRYASARHALVGEHLRIA